MVLWLARERESEAADSAAKLRDRKNRADQNLSSEEYQSNYVEGPPSGPPLVLLHGPSRDWTSFAILFPYLVPRFHVFALDLRGHGESGRVKNGYGIADFGEDVAEFIHATVPQGAAIFDHSLGAMAGMCAAGKEVWQFRRQPELRQLWQAVGVGEEILYARDF